MITNGTGNRIVVGFPVAFLIIGTAEFFSADVAGIGVLVSVGFHVAGDIVLLRKLFTTFVTHVLLKRYNRNIRYVWVKRHYFIPVMRFDRLFCLCDAYIFSGMALLFSDVSCLVYLNT